MPLSKSQKNRLTAKKKVIRIIASKKASIKRKRRIIQSGGFLGAILGPVISVLSSLFNR